MTKKSCRWKAAEAEAQRLQEAYDSLQQQKRLLEADREELEELRSRGGQLSTEEKRRLEQRILNLEEEVEEERGQYEEAQERLRKSQMQVCGYQPQCPAVIRNFRLIS